MKQPDDLDTLLRLADAAWASATLVPYTPPAPVMGAGTWWQVRPGAPWVRVCSLWWALRRLEMSVTPSQYVGERLVRREA